MLTMVGGRQTVIATSFSPVAFESITSTKVTDLSDSTCDPSIAGDLPRWIVAIPYDYVTGPQRSENSERPLAWSVKAALVWEAGSDEPRYIERPDAARSRFHLSMKTHLKDLLADAKKYIPGAVKPLSLLPSTSDDSYLESVRGILGDIKAGDFYQVNLLRFFQSPAAHGWQNICALMEMNTGPHGALMTQGSRVIASLSPERFIEINPGPSSTEITTWPIKGTAPRILDDPTKDDANGKNLFESAKDQAELRMIIDLMRNDLTKICAPGTVEVTEPCALKKFQHVWHLEGKIRGTVQPGQTILNLLDSLCPGGSVTGAPKIAAMEKIRSEEGQSRGFFMGHVFRFNHDGSAQSNIMIRTLTSDNWMKTAKFAAGSGLVIKSDPHAELAEIEAKCAVITHTSGKNVCVARETNEDQDL